MSVTRKRIADAIPPADPAPVPVTVLPASDDLFPEPPTERSIADTFGDMAHVVLTGDAPDAPPLGIAEAFDLAQPGATLRAGSLPTDDGTGRGSSARASVPPTEPRSGAPKPRPSRRGRPAGAEQVEQLFAAGFIVLVSFTLGDWAAPTAEEASALAIPLSNILARRIDVAAKLGADANDTVAFVVAVMYYGVRVGPLAMDRARNAMEERRARTDAIRASDAPRSADIATPFGVPPRQDDAVRPTNGATYHPLHALAEARELGHSILERGAGNLPGDDHSMDH